MDYSRRGMTTTTMASTTRSEASDEDRIDTLSRPANPFATPLGSTPQASKPGSFIASSSSFQQQKHQEQPYFRSRRVDKEAAEKPWLKKKDSKEKWVTIIPIIGVLIGLGISGYLIYDGLMSVKNFTYCSVYESDFSRGLDMDVWTKEVEVGGFGNGQFEQTTQTDENAYIKDGVLIIKPTLQDKELIENNNTINLLKSGLCTSDTWANCVATTNTTNGTIVNPVKSARLSTRGGASIKYGRIEVEAKLPSGDWLWPAIWMMPVKNTYGPWPASGEIDIVESRGNNHTYNPQGGRNIMSSTLHWGPDSANDQWWQTNEKLAALHTTYADSWHTFGLEWTEKYIFTYVGSRLLQVLYTDFNKPFWQKGSFPPATANGTNIVDPWSQTGRDATPFDQEFYLIINVAVGGTNNWFMDGVAGKPWVNDSPTAKLDFWKARDQWYPTWTQPMEIRSVKMMQQSGFNGCSAGAPWSEA
ncbi:uncharacterized protein LTR77_005385 [Saxophila tyrrhenica]|uniref:GH16 domain-containing protein n=1 Tax=Saxophila tyrrhenica TaxID=1690608 RepID=A0AAV9P8Y8_9PEZI|nr:hypothetical protein LTR77_005385 [Saxophila tyrrhenica]